MAEPLKAIIIEDSEDDVALLVHELESGGFGVDARRVESPQAFREALMSPGWQIVFSDYTIPLFRGTDALELLRQTGLDIPFVFVSGTLAEGTAAEAMQAGANGYFVKGDLGRLVSTVRRELGEAEKRRRRKEITDQAREFLQAIARLEGTNEISQDDLRRVMHELREPLHAMMGYVMMLKEEAFGGITPLQSDVLQKILDYANDLAALVRSAESL